MSLKRLFLFCSSLRCTICLLLGTATLCILGTIIPQHHLTAARDAGLGAWILARLSPFDLFSSFWTAGPAGLLCLNLLLCMGRRIRPGTQGLSLRQGAVVGLHASILLIFAGIILGTSGLDARLELREGQRADAVKSADGTAIPLGFSVLCESFSLETYPNGMPKEYVSRLVFIKQGEFPLKGELKVNHPLTYEGLRFYQESYVRLPEAVLHFTGGKTSRTIRVHEGESLSLDEHRLNIHIVKIADNLMNLGPAVKLIYESNGEHGHRWIFRDIAGIKDAVPDLFLRAGSLNPELAPSYSFGLSEVKGLYITGIGVKRDPGAPLVAAGSVLFLLCLIAALLMPQRRDRRRAEKRDDGAADKSSSPHTAQLFGFMGKSR